MLWNAPISTFDHYRSAVEVPIVEPFRQRIGELTPKQVTKPGDVLDNEELRPRPSNSVRRQHQYRVSRVHRVSLSETRKPLARGASKD